MSRYFRAPAARRRVASSSKTSLNRRPLRFEGLEARSMLTAGDLDPTFGDGGHVMTDFSTVPGQHLTTQANAVLVAPDDKIVAVGLAGSGTIGGGIFHFISARYNADGSLDNTFGGDGSVEVSLGSHSMAFAAAFQVDGKLVVAGEASDGQNGDFALLRLNDDGSIDETFGNLGSVVTHISDGYDSIRSVQVDSSGNILVAGVGSASSVGFTLARYTPDGDLDATYGTGGFAESPPNVGGYALNTLLLQGDDKAVLAASTNMGIAALRYDTDGSLDSTFGTAGMSELVQGVAYGAAIQPDGKIVVGGRTGPTDNRDFVLARFTAGGQLDSNFGTAGVTITDLGTTEDDMSAGVVVQANGRIVGAGRAGRDFGLARYLPDGTLDTSFGTGGIVKDSMLRHNEGLGVALDSNGDIVVAGLSVVYPYYDSNFVLARYEGDVVLTANVAIVPDSVNLASNGTLTVLIYGAADLNAAQINVSSVQFAGASAWQWTLVDDDQDGRLDLQLKFRTQDTALQQIYEQLLVDDHDADGILDSTRQVAQVEVTGETLDDALFSGSDSINLFLAGRSLRELLTQLFG